MRKHFWGFAVLLSILSCNKSEPVKNPEIFNTPPQYSLDKTNGCFYQNGIIGGKPVSVSDPLKNKTVLVWNEFEDDKAPSTEKNKVEICTGTLIDRKIVLTAAHCISEKNSHTLVIFNHSLLCSEGMNKHLAFRTMDSVMHPTWLKNWQADPDLVEHMNSEVNNGDLALLLLEANAPTDYPTIDLWATEPLPLTSGNLIQMGYGRTRTNEENSMPALRTIEKNFTSLNRNRVSDHYIVQQKNEGGGCLGDSGGPLFVQENNKIYQIGIASFLRGSSATLCENGDLFYENIATYSSWINETKKTLQSKPLASKGSTFK